MRTFVFNGDNKQTEVKDASGATVGQYYYDGEGKRVKKYIPTTGETTIFVYSSGKLIAEYSTVVAPASVAKVAYTTTDHLGSPRVITDAIGQVVSRRDFMPFGEDLNVGVGNRTGDTGLKYSMPGDNVRQKFTGYQKDNETQLDFAEARMYENRFGRFTAVDPLLASGKSANPQSFNRFGYALNNPIVYIDSDGQIPVYFCLTCGANGTVHWTTDQKYAGDENYKRYDGRPIVVNGTAWGSSNKANYKITSEGIFSTSRSPTSPDAIEAALSHPAAKRPKASPVANLTLLKEMSRLAPGMEKFIVVFALSAAMGGAAASAAVGAGTFYLVIGAETFTAAQGLQHLSEADRERATMMMAGIQLQGSGTIDPSKVRFLQDDARVTFTDKSLPNVDQLAEGLKNGTINANDIPAIRVFKMNGEVFSLDHRRLAAFQQAGVPINYVLATPAEINAQLPRKYNTTTEGKSIRIRGR